MSERNLVVRRTFSEKNCFESILTSVFESNINAYDCCFVNTPEILKGNKNLNDERKAA